MIKKIYTVYDEKAEAYLQPFYFEKLGQAKRAVADLVNDPDHQFGKHPSDFTLFFIGDFDDSNAEIIPDKKPICNLIELKEAS